MRATPPRSSKTSPSSALAAPRSAPRRSLPPCSIPGGISLAVEARRAPRLFVLDNVDPEEIAGHLEVVLPERTLYNVISKSGETAETTAQLLVFVDALKKRLGDRWREHVVVTTDPAKGFLRSLATREKLASFPVPPDVGGRFSALSPVSLLPLAACGVEPGRLLAGAAVARAGGVQAAALYSAPPPQGQKICVMMPYSRARESPTGSASSGGVAVARHSLDGREVLRGRRR